MPSASTAFAALLSGIRRNPLLFAVVGAFLVACESDGSTGPAPVASVSVTAPATELEVGRTVQLSATARDASGQPLTGRSVTWSSSSAAVATVDGNGLVTGVGAGAVTITASVEGRTGSASLAVRDTRASRVQVSPSFARLEAGQATQLSAAALNAQGQPVSGAAVSWSSLATEVATVDAQGRVVGVHAGVARLVATSGTATDTAVVAVLGPSSVLATALVGGEYRAAARAGAALVVTVALDVSRVSANGDVGSAQFELGYDPAVLRFDSASVAGVQGSAMVNEVEPGRIRYALAATSPQGSAVVTLTRLHFRVAAGAAAGATRALTLSMPSRPSSTSFRAYETPLVVGGRVQVTAQ